MPDEKRDSRPEETVREWPAIPYCARPTGIPHYDAEPGRSGSAERAGESLIDYDKALRAERGDDN